MEKTGVKDCTKVSLKSKIYYAIKFFIKLSYSIVVYSRMVEKP